MVVFGNNGSNFRLTVKFKGVGEFCQMFEPKNCASRQILRMWMPFLHRFITLKELTAEGLTDSSWNTLENIKRHHERDFLHLKHFWT